MRAPLLALAALVVACKSSAPPPPVDAGPKKPSVDGVTKITVHETSNAAGVNHDLVLELVRDGVEVAWTAKLTDRGAAFGEPTPEANPTSASLDVGCACAVAATCPCEDPRGGEVIRKSGRGSPAAFDAFVSQLGKANLESSDGGVLEGSESHVHVVLSGTSVVHLARTNDARPWALDGQELGAKAALDSAFLRLLDAVGARGWIAALHPLPAVVAPRGFAELAKADALELEDDGRDPRGAWSVQLRLERNGANFDWRGKFSHRANAFGSSVPDRYTDRRRSTCFCAVAETCACEAEKSPEKKSGSVPAAVVERFLGALAKRDLSASVLGGWPAVWTEESPEGHVVVWPVGAAPPIHLGYVDPARTWGVNGRQLFGDAEKGQKDVTAAYLALLDALGLGRFLIQK